MSELRKQLERARREHREVRYPGDLAADVLGVGSSARRWGVWVGRGLVGVAAAAAVAVVVWRVEVGDGGQKTSVAVKGTPTVTTKVETGTAGQAEGNASDVAAVWPAGVSVVPRGVTVGVASVGGEVSDPAVTAGKGETITPVVTGSMVPVFPSMSEVMSSSSSSSSSESGGDSGDTKRNSQENS